MKSVMVHNFSRVPEAKIPRSQFQRDFGHKTTLDVDYLVPFYRDFALPGDTAKVNVTAFARMASPLSTPLMDNMFMDFFFFAVPVRLIWDNFHKMMGEQANPGDSTDYTIPTMPSTATTGYDNMTLHDYLGLPTKVATSYDHSSLYHRAHNLIINEWFRDQNLIDSLVVDKDDGPDDPADYVLKKRGKRHDYFTSCLPWPQKGDAVDLPLGTSAPIAFEGVSGNEAGVYESDGTAGRLYDATGSSANAITWQDSTPSGGKYLYADLTNATAATVNELRQAFQMQKLLERDARGGTRYTEIIKAHFGVTSPDFRLQRPEYLGGGSVPVNITPIAQNSQSDTTPQGTLASIATANASGIGFTKSFTEHCVLLGFVNIRADLTYQEGLPREFSWSTRYDLYWPALAHIGEQAVLNKEIYCDGSANDELVFGYQERYGELRYKPSMITGQFRSNDANTLDSWHLSQAFGSLPSLNETFITTTTPIERVKAIDTNVPDFIFDSLIKGTWARPMPLFGTPGLLDHF